VALVTFKRERPSPNLSLVRERNSAELGENRPAGAHIAVNLEGGKSPAVKEVRAWKWRRGAAQAVDDALAVEEPLEIRLGGRRFTLTMRTPGHDEELAAGFLLAEGFVEAAQEIGEIRRVRDARGHPEPNAIDIILKVPAAGLRERLKRNFTVSSSCGVCGKTSIEAIQRRLTALGEGPIVTPKTLMRMPVLMREEQAVFNSTGGLHAAALFAIDEEKPDEPELIVLREDVGRHNAVDKVIGHALRLGLLPLRRSALMVSGRLSFEIVQKAAAAGIPLLCAVSAPSSLAVELAEEIGTTLVGFLRDGSFNIYTRPDRITL
jgi:FdhD protein